MNAHSTPHLSLVPPTPVPDPNAYDRGLHTGTLIASVSALGQAAYAADLAAAGIQHSIRSGADAPTAYRLLQDVAERLREASRTADAALAVLSSRVAGVP